MKERPILFNGEMVRAILEGRKTQTRRIVKPQPKPCDYVDEKGKPRGGHWWPSNAVQSMVHIEEMLQDCDGVWRGLINTCNPFGGKGDHLWVRETFASGLCTKSTLAYRATHKSEDLEEGWFETIKWTPSIHMPRWACRLVLEITNVRVERLNSISEKDAEAEGIVADEEYSAEEHFSMLWTKTYGWDKGGWNANPWVWVVEFKVIQGGAA